MFILNWSDTLVALNLTQTHAETATVYLAGLQADEINAYGPNAALSVLLTIPPAVLGLVFRRHLLTGLSLGTVRR